MVIEGKAILLMTPSSRARLLQVWSIANSKVFGFQWCRKSTTSYMYFLTMSVQKIKAKALYQVLYFAKVIMN